MGIVNDFKNSIQQATLGKVWGTFNKTFSALDNEKEREDGTTVFDLVPEIRVFIGGAEVTKDVDSVNVTHSLDGNSCSITIHNPRGRYEISKYDLMMKWREDKDILAAYDYKYFDRVDPLNYDVLARKLGDALLGRGGGALVGESIDMTKQTIGLLGGLLNPFPLVKGVTRMLFETKFESGLTRRTGDCIFDYRDPVYVFMKGRFSTYWYFAFSGFVISYSDSDAYGDIKTITLKCEDTMTLWKKTKISTKGAFFGMSNMENRVVNVNKGSAANPMADFASSYNFSNLMKVIAFSYDYGLKTQGCNIFSRRNDTNFKTLDYKILKSIMHDSTKIDQDFKFTYNRKPLTIQGRTILAGQGIIDTKDINYLHFKGGPNKYPLSPMSSIYLQHNEIELNSGEFKGDMLEKAFDLSVRYWEYNQEINEKFSIGSDAGTGWKDKSAFGVCGAHPALTYNFIDNFNILETVWKQLYLKKKNIDNLIISPYDKIRETIAGSPTEAVPGNSTIISKEPAGTNINLFRPRLFVILPQKYAGVRKAGNEGFGDLGSLFNEQSTTIYSYLKEKLRSVEYINYTSPMGDIFIEPALYDFHPLEFCNRIEGRNIIQKRETILFKDYITKAKEDAEGKPIQINKITVTEKKPIYTVESAYFFNPKANHPFFIMDKDRIRDTFEFDPNKMTSAVEVVGSATDFGGGLEIDISEVNAAFSFMTMGSGEQYAANNPFTKGMYIADGFDDYYSDTSQFIAISEQTKKVKEAQSIFKKMVFSVFLKNALTFFIFDIINNFKESVIQLKKKNIEWDPDITSNIITLNESTQMSDSDFEQYITTTYCTNIFINQYSLPTFLKKKVSNFFEFLIKSKNADEKSLSLNIQFKNAQKKSATNSTEDTELSEKLLIEYENLGFFDMEDNSNDSILGTKRGIVLDFLRLFEPYAILNDAQVMDQYKLLLEAKSQLPSTKELAATSLKDLKKLQIEGIYDPRKDIVRLYGYNKAEPIKNPYIKNGTEALYYAKAVFNRLYGQAHSISIDCVGRPEFFLNRPYFFERKDCIGLMKNYSLSFKYGGDFSSNVTLTYIRKNALTYGYSLGEELDEPKGDKTNSYFHKQGKLYLQTQTAIAQAGKLAGMAAQNAIAGNSTNFGKQIAGNITGDLVSGAIGTIGQSGGIYVAHNMLGHMEYDARGRIPDSTADVNSKQETAIIFPLQSNKLLQSLTASIKAEQNIITTNINNIKLKEEEIPKKEAEIKKIELDIKAKDSEINSITVFSHADTLLKSARTRQKEFLIKNLKTLTSEKSGLENAKNSMKTSVQSSLSKLFGFMYTGDPSHPELKLTFRPSILYSNDTSKDGETDKIIKAWYKYGYIQVGIDLEKQGGLYFSFLLNYMRSYDITDLTKVNVTWNPINGYYCSSS